MDLNTKVKSNVCFGDNTKVKIKGKGTILFQAKDESHKVIHDVYYIPKLRSNILSIGQLMETGCKIIMEGRTLWLKNHNGDLLVNVAMTNNRMFKLDLWTTESVCLKTCVEDSSWI